MGEGIGNDDILVPFIDCANIACGYHAGDAETIQRTIELCIQHKVAIGAHPSFLDRQNFGRTEVTISSSEIYELVTQQLYIFKELADLFNQQMMHVKPHGALYNMSARDVSIASAIAAAVKDFDSKLILFGLSGSCSIEAGNRIGLQTAKEVFADRSYGDDGNLTPRSMPGAMLDEAGAIRQVSEIIQQGTVTSISGKKIPVQADTVCVHGDSGNALAIAKAVHSLLRNEK
jgi:UPF0271 protein